MPISCREDWNTNFPINRNLIYLIVLVLILFTFCFEIYSAKIALAETEAGAHNKTEQGKVKPKASIATDRNSVLFKGPDGTVVLKIALVDLKSKPNDRDQIDIYSIPVISSDGSHVGIFTEKSVSSVDMDEALMTTSFKFYDYTGKLWELEETSAGYYLPHYNADEDYKIMSKDGSRLLLIWSYEGGDPQIKVYNPEGKIIFQKDPEKNGGFSKAEISPNGKYIAITLHIFTSVRHITDLVRVFDIDKNTYADFQFSAGNEGSPNIKVTTDGRFLVSIKGREAVLP